MTMGCRPKNPDHPDLHCPSAQPDLPGAVAFGLIEHGGEAPTTAYFEEPVPVTSELLDMAAPLRPTEVFRFSAPCQQQRCSHWEGACTLVDRIVNLLPVSSLTLPPCQIRADCRWFAEQGRDACRRCPQIITQNTRASELMVQAAEPPSRAPGAGKAPTGEAPT